MIFVHTKDEEDFSIWSEFEKWVELRNESCIDFIVRIAESDNFEELRGFQNAADIVVRSGGKFRMQIRITGDTTDMIKNIARIYKAVGDFGCLYADPMDKSIYFCSDTSFLVQEENTMAPLVIERIKEILVNKGIDNSSALKICKLFQAAKMRSINADSNDINEIQMREFCFVPVKEEPAEESDQEFKYSNVIFNNIDVINSALLSLNPLVQYDICYKIFFDREKTVISVPKNTRAAWQNAFELYRLKDNFLRNFYTEFKFNVELHQDDFSDKTDVTNLRFFYPLNKLDSRCVMNVIPDNQSDAKRASQFCIKCPNAVSINNKRLQYEETAASDIFPIIKIEAGNNIMGSIDEVDVLKDDISYYKAYLEKNEKVKKLKISDYDHKENMPALTYLICLYLLRFYVNTENCETISNSVVTKIASDAKSYSEGFYQVIENACLHSHGHCAYFAMRIHKANRIANLKINRGATMSDFEKEQRTRQMLYNKYSEGANQDDIFNNSKYNYYIEFFVIDCAIDSGNKEIDGILDTFNKYRTPEIKSIEKLITLTEEDFSDKEKYYTEHYGLRWFDKIVDKNHGIIHVLSPFDHGKDISLYISKGGTIGSDAYRKGSTYFTEYNVLIPLSYSPESHANEESAKNRIKMLDRPDVVLEPLAPKKVPANDNIYNLDKKSDKIDFIYNDIIESIGKYNCIAQLDCKDMPFGMVEITAKAIFKSIFLKRSENNNNPIYISVYFGTYKEHIAEFVRIFSIFYDKSGDNGYMENVQIALCGKDEIYNVNKVYFVIAGKNLKSAYETASKLFYYDSYYMAENMYILDYLVSSSKDKNSAGGTNVEKLQIVPFDIFLCEDKVSWFLKHMSSMLNTEITDKNNGCKIVGTHVRISSRIHLEDFYEAEHLFHNEGNVYRFAMLIANDIIVSHQEEKNLFIVGYENYSSILINLIQSLIKNVYDGSANVYSAISTTNESGVNDIVTMNMSELKGGEKLYVYTIIPIGTTMSTIYKIHNTVRKKFGDKFTAEFKKNYSLIAVSDYLADFGAAKTGEGILRRYWDIDRMTEGSYEIILQKEISDKYNANSEDTKVKYYLAASSQWHDPENCDLCKRGIPLIQVDKTSTIPATIMISEKDSESSSKLLDLRKNSQENLKDLEPKYNGPLGQNYIYVHYSHIVRGENHYQFYFDFQRLLSTKRQEEIEKWLKEITIDSTAYNILVSPLNVTNPMFLSLLINNVFSSGVRLLHADINSTLKENIKVRYSYIAQEIKEQKKVDPHAKINVFYADDSMVSGRTAERGKMFIKMLLDDAGISSNEVALYKKVFLLINRNSYETMSSLVEKPAENVHSYIWLSLPSYNTNNGVCPSCKVQDQFELLKKRSATIRTAREFSRLQHKHEKRTPEEYEAWLESEILNNHSYFAWLKLWLFYNSDHKSLNDDANKFIENLRERIVKFVKNDAENRIKYKNKYSDFAFSRLFSGAELNDETKDEYLNTLSEHSLQDFLTCFDDDIFKTQVIGLMRYIVAERAHLRLISMNKAYVELHGENSGRVNEESLIKELFEEYEKSLSERQMIYRRFDIMESVVKVVSRDLLGRYFYVRNDILGKMKNIVMSLAGDRNPDKDFEFLRSKDTKKYTDPCAALQYRLFMTVIHRMAMFQTSTIYEEDFMNKFSAAYNRLRDKYFFSGEYSDVKNALSEKEKTDLLCLTEIPSSDKAAEKYMCSVKAATMLTDDDSACFALLKKGYEKGVNSADD